MKPLKQSILLTICSLIFTFTIVLSVFIFGKEEVKAQTELPALFVSNTCPYSNELLDQLELDQLNEKYEFETIEISSDTNKDRYQRAYEVCRPNAAVRYTPMMFYEGKCYEGKTNVAKKLYELAQVEYKTDDSSDSESDKTAVELVKTEEQSEQSGESLDDRLNENKVPELPKINFFEGLALLVFPSMFLLIGYLLIKKMKL